MEKSKSDVWVGLFVLIGAAAILFLALQSANLLSLSFQPTYQVVARFDNIGGLSARRQSRAPGWWWAAWNRSASTISRSRPG